MSWFPGIDEERRSEPAQVSRGGLVLAAAAAMGEVAARDHELGGDAVVELADRPLQRRVVEPVPCAEMKVGHVKDAR